MNLGNTVVCSFVAIVAGLAQQPSFEVASIKISNTPPQRGEARQPIRTGPNSLTIRFARVVDLITWAYDVQSLQVAGEKLPDGSFDILAKTSAPVSRDEMRKMLQTLLAERFQLKLHRESKTMSAFALLKGKNPKLEPADGDGDMAISPPAGATLVMEHCSMPELAFMLSEIFRTPVVDLTEIRGRFNLKFDMTPFMKADTGEVDGLRGEGAMFYIAVQDLLGLKLERRKMPVDVLVVDHVEKLAEN